MNIEDGKIWQRLGVKNLAAAVRCIAVLLILFAWDRSAFAEAAKPVIPLTPADYTEIYNLYAAYSVALDTGNGPARVATFTPDGTMSSFLSNHVPYHMDRLLKMTNDFGKKERPIGGHMQMLIHLTPTTAGADATCYAILGGAKPDANGNFVGTPAFYTDTLVKTPSGWRFKSREVFIGAPGDKNY